MAILLNKDFIKEVKKELRNKNNASIGTYVRIDIENKKIMFSFNRYNHSKYATEKEVKIVLEDNIEVENCYKDIKCIHMHNIDFNDVFLDVLLSEKVIIELYKKNIKNFIDEENGIENYMSTVIIRNEKKLAKYSTICNKYCDMIID